MGDKKKKNMKSTKRTTKQKNGKRVKSKHSNSTALVRKKDVKMKFKYKHPKLALALKIIFITLILLCVVWAGIVIGLIKGSWEEDFTIDMSELILKENSVI